MKFLIMNIKYRITKILLISVFITLYLPLYTQDLKFEHIGNSNDLRSHSVNLIIQDKKGFLWLGTPRGLVRYDGYDFKLFNKKNQKDSLCSDHISAIFEDSSGILWIGTRKGLHFYNSKTEKINFFILKEKNKVLSIRINIIYEDEKKRLWIGTNRGIIKLNKERSSIKNFVLNNLDRKSIIDNVIGGIGEDKGQNIWIITMNGLSKFNEKNNDFINFPLLNNCIDNKKKKRATAYYINHNNEIWLGISNHGLMKFDIKKLQYKVYKDPFSGQKSLKNNMIFNINQDSRGNLWLSTINGLFIVDIKKNKWKIYKHSPGDTHSLSHNYIWTTFEDKNNNFWIGTLGGSLNKLGRNNVFFNHILQGTNAWKNINSKTVLSIYEDKLENLWIGTDNGLNYWDNKEKKFFYFKDKVNYNFFNNYLSSLYEDDKQILWIGTGGGGLKKFNMKKKTFETFVRNSNNFKSISNNTINKIFEDCNKTLWIGTNFGLNKFKYKKKEFIRYGTLKNNKILKSRHILDIFEDSNKTLWIGTYKGLYVFDRDKKVFLIHSKISLINQTIITIFEDSYSNLWFGTNSGLVKFNRKKNKTITFDTSDGLADERIRGIIEDNNKSLWIGTNYGLSKYSIKDNTFINYFKNDGILSNAFIPRAFHINEKGRIIFGGLNGITSFYPENIKKNFKPPNIIITEFKLFNKIIKPGKNSILSISIQDTKKIILNYKQDFFSFEFTALDFTNPSKNEYKYRLEGVDKDWIYCNSKRRFANYTDIEPGSYTFSVMGSNSDGVWNTKRTSIKIVIAPPLWDKWWFKLLLALLFLFLMIFLYRRRILKIEQKWREENAVNELCIKYKISSREKEILNLVLIGKSNKDIEDILFISYNTVKNHVYNIFSKIGVKSRGDLILFFTTNLKLK